MTSAHDDLPPLDAPLALMRAALALRHVMQHRLKRADAGISPAELAILHLLQQDDGQRVGPLADQTTRDRTVLTRIVDRLENKSLVERRPDPEDRRAVRLWITSTGRALHERLLPIRTHLVEQATGHLSPEERATLIEALVGIRNRLIHLTEED